MPGKERKRFLPLAEGRREAKRSAQTRRRACPERQSHAKESNGHLHQLLLFPNGWSRACPERQSHAKESNGHLCLRQPGKITGFSRCGKNKKMYWVWTHVLRRNVRMGIPTGSAHKMPLRLQADSLSRLLSKSITSDRLKLAPLPASAHTISEH